MGSHALSIKVLNAALTTPRTAPVLLLYYDHTNASNPLHSARSIIVELASS